MIVPDVKAPKNGGGTAQEYSNHADYKRRHRALLCRVTSRPASATVVADLYGSEGPIGTTTSESSPINPVDCPRPDGQAPGWQTNSSRVPAKIIRHRCGTTKHEQRRQALSNVDSLCAGHGVDRSD
jgi:hypothetical protein